MKHLDKNITISDQINKRIPLVALVSFGETSTRNILTILNRLGVDYRIILPNEIPMCNPTHIILSGGPKHVYEDDSYHLPEWVIKSKCPVLGICYGMQLIAYTFGGTVVKMPYLEKGPVEVTEITLSRGSHVQSTSYRWMNRHDQIISVPHMFDVTGVTNKNDIAAFTDHKKWWTVQYHPESFKHGDINIFENFFKIWGNFNT